ncbi:PREDICTED: tumor necrosis factor receptor superfamily member 11B-like [Branchiostoma belcheri]|uniref:Tumor necrosis factor receptor superfamily member 6 n=1 Tax=Branchiostoma belcheri TaxID=7741 RepID=A0A6P4Z7I5_BRABE|nr:PREDICTED: tumor necrosis factor receptor superfamily member 11B-like [Branchiostoma belcheri]
MAALLRSAVVVILTTVLFVAGEPVQNVTSSPKFKYKDPASGRRLLCDQCPPGTRLKDYCTANSPTVCQVCPDNHFTEYYNWEPECRYCNEFCGKPNQKVSEECTTTHNRRCECILGFFLDLEICRAHRRCPRGHGVVRKGTPNSDVVCRRCKQGTFSDETSNTVPCRPHRNCTALGLTFKRHGSRHRDAICADSQSEETDRPNNSSTTQTIEDDNLRKAVEYVAKNLSVRWQKFAKNLPGKKVPRRVLKKIKDSNSSRRQRVTEVLTAWVEVNGKKADVKGIEKALRRSGQKELAKRVGKMCVYKAA